MFVICICISFVLCNSRHALHCFPVGPVRSLFISSSNFSHSLLTIGGYIILLLRLTSSHCVFLLLLASSTLGFLVHVNLQHPEILADISTFADSLCDGYNIPFRSPSVSLFISVISSKCLVFHSPSLPLEIKGLNKKNLQNWS